MAVGAVQQSQPTNVVKGTIVAGAIGAGVNAASSLGYQKILMSSPDAVEFLKEGMKNTEGMFAGKGLLNKYMQWGQKTTKRILDKVSQGKFDWKSVGTCAAIGAGIVGGIYLAYRGIKALCSGNKEA